MRFRPVLLCLLILSLLAFALPQAATAQDGTVWIQIEAQPTPAKAEERAQAWAMLFPETGGFRLRSGWYGVMLGPYPEAEARDLLTRLNQERLIPGDSFIAFERDFGARFWPPEGVAPTLPASTADAAADVAAILSEPAPVPEPQPQVAPDETLPDETPTEARDAEVLLTPEDRLDLQTALQWFGFYDGGIDGAFGPGTRASMAAWQQAWGMLEPTGVLTSRQRGELLQTWRDEIAAFGFAEVIEAEAGITLTLPLGLVAFDRYEPPFVHFVPRADQAPRLLLISQPGDQAALTGLYDLLQSLESVPLTGERSRDDRSFRIRGTSASVDTTVFAELTGGFIKGWMLISAPDQAARDARIIDRLEASFATDDTRALDPGMAVLTDDTRAGLRAGLDVRKPRLSRSGFFISADGAVLTTTEAVTGCGRVTIDRTTTAEVRLTDPVSGLALVVPQTPLAPRKVAEFRLAPERPGTEVTVAGYSYEDRLPAPVLTFGRLEEITGLNGEPGLNRLSLEALAGDAGGPVLDASGTVIGMLLPAAAASATGKQLPSGVHFAIAASEIAKLLAPTASPALPGTRQGAISPVDLGEIGTGMTVLVSCWD